MCPVQTSAAKCSRACEALGLEFGLGSEFKGSGLVFMVKKIRFPLARLFIYFLKMLEVEKFASLSWWRQEW